MKDLSHNIKSSIINIPKGIVKLIYNYRILDFDLFLIIIIHLQDRLFYRCLF